uniref:hypothetical protein n=1 Tax=Candidatus Hodgkinia cicadicola TaxID=573658 RepID=UPI002414E30E
DHSRYLIHYYLNAMVESSCLKTYRVVVYGMFVFHHDGNYTIKTYKFCKYDNIITCKHFRYLKDT